VGVEGPGEGGVVKTCPRCAVAKDVSAFHRSARLGHQRVCKDCFVRQYQGLSPEEKVARVTRNRQRRHADPLRAMLSGARNRATRLGVPFDITLADIPVPAECPVLGIPLRWSERRTDATPSLDRVDPKKGYVRGNVFVISWRANKIKTDATITELRAVLRYVEPPSPLDPDRPK
jgi:hypothetical protein